MKTRITITLFWCIIIITCILSFVSKDLPDILPFAVLLISRAFIQPENNLRWKYAIRSFWIGIALHAIGVLLIFIFQKSWANYIGLPFCIAGAIAALFYIVYIIFSDFRRFISPDLGLTRRCS